MHFYDHEIYLGNVDQELILGEFQSHVLQSRLGLTDSILGKFFFTIKNSICTIDKFFQTTFQYSGSPREALKRKRQFIAGLYCYCIKAEIKYNDHLL